jgi:(p)ppGpp synthase/HD superfamily hydrolase
MLTDRFSDALGYAEQLHRAQTRKGNDIPYIAHLLTVTATVLEWGGDEDTAIAALLHDAVEDQGGETTALAIRERFGDRVADLVLHCTDSTSADPVQKPAWLDRKTAYLARLVQADRSTALITVADKLHNITATLRDVRAHGAATLDRFHQPSRLTWYYASVADALEPHAASLPLGELRAAIAELRQLVDPPAPGPAVQIA